MTARFQRSCVLNAAGPAEKPNKKVSSWAADGSNIERHVKPMLDSKIAKALTQADIPKFEADEWTPRL